jgi:hypothetical protein
MWIEFRVSVSDHCQRFGNCLGFAIRRDEWIIACPIALKFPVRTSPR